MIPSLRGQLDLVRDHLVPVLCSAQDFAPLHELSDRVPVVSTLGFERALASTGSGLDLSIAFRRPHPAGRYFAADQDVGERTRALLAATGDPASPLHRAFGVYWLEYDTSEGGRRPSLFAGPRAVAPEAVVRDASEIVLGGALTPGVSRAVTRWSAPRDGIKLFQIGWMLGRSRPGLRLCFCAFEVEAMRALIEAMTTGAQREALVACCRRYAEIATEIAFAVDVGDGDVAPRVGLEFGFRGWKPEQSLRRWGDLLDRLLEDGLCSRDDCRRLLAWPGRMTEQSSPDAWPRHLRGAGALLGPYQARLDRALHHVKLVVQDGVVTGAKAYLVMFQTWGRA